MGEIKCEGQIALALSRSDETVGSYGHQLGRPWLESRECVGIADVY